MKMLIHSGLSRILTGWMVFVIGLMLLWWLHTFRDRLAHLAILPSLFLLWIILALSIWDGCKHSLCLYGLSCSCFRQLLHSRRP